MVVKPAVAYKGRGRSGGWGKELPSLCDMVFQEAGRAPEPPPLHTHSQPPPPPAPDEVLEEETSGPPQLLTPDLGQPRITHQN